MEISKLHLSARTYNTLNNAGIQTVEQLQKMSEEKVRNLKGMSDRKIIEIRTAMEQMDSVEPVGSKKVEVVKQQPPAEKTPIETLEQNIENIKHMIMMSARSFCMIGYYLKQIRDNKQYEAKGYADIWECAEQEFGFSKSVASRHMKMNDMFSVGGNSSSLDDKYKSFNKSQLTEMMYLEEKDREEVTADMPVAEIRKLNPNYKKKEEQVAEVIPIPVKSEPVALKPVVTSQQEETEDCIADTSSHFTTSIPKKISDTEETEDDVIEVDYREVKEPKEEPKQTQPEFPLMKNMDQREEFINSFKTWPVWCKNELVQETFYRYDLPDGSAIVVRYYPSWMDWKKEMIYGKQFYLLKKDYKAFHSCETNMTALKEHLKEVQKKK